MKMLKKSLPVKTVRLVTEKRLMSDEILDNPVKVRNMLVKELSDQPREVVAVLYLDSALHPITIGLISMGTIDASLVNPAQIIQTGLLCNAKSMIMFHNHPSGRLVASKDDIELTKQMVAVGKLMDMPVLDHIIIGNYSHLSMKIDGTVNFETDKTLEELVAEAGIGI